MPSPTNEKALEMAIEKALTGTCLEELAAMPGLVARDPEAIYGSDGTYHIGDATHYNAKYAIDEHRFWQFLEATQKEELAKLKRSP
jgi:type I restriction enzyme R subunit